MTRNSAPLPRPTDAELRILQVLWSAGPSTVREVHEALVTERPAGYTTTLKLLQVMHDKGLVRRDDTERSHVYEAVLAESETQRQVAGDLLTRVFRGSASALVLGALSATKSSPEELRRIKDLIAQLEAERGEGA